MLESFVPDHLKAFVPKPIVRNVRKNHKEIEVAIAS
jgi:hypothetical protein